MPNFLIQFFTFLRREIRLQFRLSRSLLLDQFLVLLAGGTLGALRKDVSKLKVNYYWTFNKMILTLCLLLLPYFEVTSRWELWVVTYNVTRYREGRTGIGQMEGVSSGISLTCKNYKQCCIVFDTNLMQILRLFILVIFVIIYSWYLFAIIRKGVPISSDVRCYFMHALQQF